MRGPNKLVHYRPYFNPCCERAILAYFLSAWKVTESYSLTNLEDHRLTCRTVAFGVPSAIMYLSISVTTLEVASGMSDNNSTEGSMLQLRRSARTLSRE